MKIIFSIVLAVLLAGVAEAAVKVETFEDFRVEMMKIVDYGAQEALVEFAKTNPEFCIRLAEEYWAAPDGDPRKSGDWAFGPLMFTMVYDPDNVNEYIDYLGQLLEEGNPNKIREFVSTYSGYSRDAMGLLDKVIEEHPDEKQAFQAIKEAIGKIIEDSEAEAAKEAGRPDGDCIDFFFGAQNSYNNNFYEQALERYGKSRDCYLANHEGGETEFSVRALGGMGSSLHSMGLFEEAMEMYEKALPLISQVIGEDDGYNASMLDNIGAIYHTRNDTDTALLYYNRSLELRERTLGKRDPAVTYSYANIADVYRDRDDYETAMNYYRKALRVNMARYGKDHPEVANNYMDIGYLLKLQGDYRTAVDFHEKALEICINTYGEMHSTTAQAYHNLGVDWAEIGDREKALEYYGKALDIRIRSLGANHHRVADSYLSIGNVYKWAGDYEPAMEYFRKALDIRLAAFGEKSAASAYMYDIIGLTYMYMDDEEHAVVSAEKALDIYRELYGPDHPVVAGVYSTIGMIFQRFQSNERALEFYLKELDILVAGVGETNKDTAFAHNSVGITYFYMGYYDEALDHLEKSLSARMKLYGRNNPSLAQSYMNIGLVKSYQNDYEGALMNYKSAVKLLCRSSDDTRAEDCVPGIMTVKTIRGMAQMHLAFGKVPEAGDAFYLAAEVLDLMREGLESESAKKQQGESFYDMFPVGLGVFSTLAAGYGRGEPEYERAFEFAEKGIARVFMEMVGQSLSIVHGGIPDETLAEGDNLEAEVKRIRQLLEEEESQPEELRDEISRRKIYDAYLKAKDAVKLYQGRLEKDYPEYAELKKPKTRSLADIREVVIGENEAALEYYLGKKESYLIYITRDDIEIKWLPESAEIDQLVELFRTKLTSPAIPEESLKSTANKLYALLIAPVKEKLAGVERLLIVPTGKLYFMPFEALVDDENKYISESFEMRYAPSLNVLYLVAGRNGNRGDTWNKYKQWMGFGDPVYEEADDRSGDSGIDAGTQRMMAAYTRAMTEGGDDPERGAAWRRIPGTGAEVKEIASLFGNGSDADIFLGREATESSFKEAARNGARFLHVASHGTLGEGGARQPALVLSLVGNQGSGEDGFLTMSEVLNMKTPAEMVVLSACKTGQGAMEKGEGVAGMARAFLFSGADSLVVSLWSVADEQTKDFMVSFYGKLLGGMDREKALAQVRREMMSAGLHPYYWAPFVMIGVD